VTNVNELRYQTGFGAHFESEAVAGALPKGRNSPQRPAYGLYAEQLSGSAFTAPRHENRRSWLYRMRPTADHLPFAPYDGSKLFAQPAAGGPIAPNRLRWDPPADLPDGTDFVDGLVTMMVNRDPSELTGVAIHLYRASRSMKGRVLVDADGELLIIPQSGTLRLFTEMGRMDLAPGWVGIVPRGVRFRVELDGEARGYVAEKSRCHVPPARAWSDRLQRSCQRARFRNAGRGLRGQRRTVRGHPEISGSAVGYDTRS
jgi:homogentisate 1,2-dioxygenase